MSGEIAFDAPQRHADAPGRIHTLHPGDIAVGERGDRLETLLGSCVAIVLTDPRRTVGAMCHVVHAGTPVGPAGASCACGGVAFEAMKARLRARAITPGLCEAYVVGGGNMFPERYGAANVGEANVRWAFEVLAVEGIRVRGHDVLGTVYRRLAWTVGPDAPAVVAVPV